MTKLNQLPPETVAYLASTATELHTLCKAFNALRSASHDPQIYAHRYSQIFDAIKVTAPDVAKSLEAGLAPPVPMHSDDHRTAYIAAIMAPLQETRDLIFSTRIAALSTISSRNDSEESKRAKFDFFERSNPSSETATVLGRGIRAINSLDYMMAHPEAIQGPVKREGSFGARPLDSGLTYDAVRAEITAFKEAKYEQFAKVLELRDAMNAIYHV